jgi:Domain of unknown function (DUF4214)
MMSRPEYANAQVVSLYAAYLHRQPTGVEVAQFAGMLAQGGGSDQVAAIVLGSPEYYFSRGGGTRNGFVAALYQDVLGTYPDQGAVAYFTQELAGGATRAAVAQQVETSPAARQRWLVALYAKYLHHAPSGAAPFGGREQVISQIIGSDEYCRLP